MDAERSEVDAKTLYYIFNSVNPNKFYRIATCKYVKEVWGILAVTPKDTSTVKFSKLQILTAKFESIKMKDERWKMKDDETFFKFQTKLSDIINSCFNLG